MIKEFSFYVYCGAYIGIGGMRIENESRQKDEQVAKKTQEVQGPSTTSRKFQGPPTLIMRTEHGRTL